MASDLFVILCGSYEGLEVSELHGALEATGTDCSRKPTIPNVSRITCETAGAMKVTKRLALSFFLCQEILFSRASPRDVINQIRRGLNIPETSSFRVKVRRLRKAIPPQEVMKLERDIGEVLSSDLRARVDLQNPGTEFIMYVTCEGFVFGTKLGTTARGELKWRSNKMKPFKHSSTLQPDLSRVLVNLAR